MRVDQIGTSEAAVLVFPSGPSNANQALRTLRRMLSYAADVGVLRGVPRIKLRKYGREGIITPEWEALLLHVAEEPLGDILTIIFDCGMRPEEVMRMKPEHIQWDRDRLLVPYGKSMRSKRYPSPVQPHASASKGSRCRLASGFSRLSQSRATGPRLQRRGTQR